MIRHTILFKVKSTVSNDEIHHALAAMKSLGNSLTGIFAIYSGECHFHDVKSRIFFSHAISHAISIDFIDKNALDNFFNNPVTHPAKNEIVKIAEGGYEGLIGFDLENKDI
jgi:hypothetical protein